MSNLPDGEAESLFEQHRAALASGDRERIDASTKAMMADIMTNRVPMSEEEIEQHNAEARRIEAEAMKDIPAANPDALISGIELPTDDEHALTRLQEFFSRTFGFTNPGGMQVVPSDPFLRDVLIVVKQLDKATLGLTIAASEQFLECDHVRTEETAEHMTAREQARFALEDVMEFENIYERLHQADPGGQDE